MLKARTGSITSGRIFPGGLPNVSAQRANRRSLGNPGRDWIRSLIDCFGADCVTIYRLLCGMDIDALLMQTVKSNSAREARRWGGISRFALHFIDTFGPNRA